MLVRDWLKRWLPLPIKIPLRMVVATFRPYMNYDSTTYWRLRAHRQGQMAVMWDERYTQLFRERQQEILRPFVEALPTEARVLDIGCGIGIVARMMTRMRADIHVDAVDFSEMVEVSRMYGGNERITYHIGSAEEFHAGDGTYDLVLSSSCYGVIIDLSKLQTAVGLGFRMTKPKGTLLMLDPLHVWTYLARARITVKQLGEVANRNGFSLAHRSGFLFWPFRDWLIESRMSDELLRRRFYLGERLLRLGGDFWADYKVLAFRRIYAD